MQLEPAQLEAVKSWLAEGASLSDVQKRLKEELGVSMLYLDLRMLVLDIGASVREKEAPKPADPPAGRPAEKIDEADEVDDDETDDGGNSADLPRITVSLDRIMKPGALVSGEAEFPGNQKIHWVLDQMGRLAIDKAPPNFKPSQDEASAFQLSLRETLMKNGYA